MVKKTKNLYRGLGWPYLFAHFRFWTAPYRELEKLILQKGFVIDLGCGYGIFANYLSLTGPGREILGIELDHQKIKLANHGLKNVRFLEADITKINTGKASAILLIHVLHHLNSFKEQETLLAACQQKLAKNGKLLIVEVAKKPILKYWLGWLADRLLYPGDNIFYRSPAEFKKLFRRLGFRVKIVKADKGHPFANIIYILDRR